MVELGLYTVLVYQDAPVALEDFVDLVCPSQFGTLFEALFVS